jgi:hypothetical protein
MDTMDVDQKTLLQPQIAASGFAVCAQRVFLLSMASGVLLLVLRWGDLTGFLAR